VSGSRLDVLVVGAGIVGATCARGLAERGRNVEVVDAGLHGATGAGMGHLLVLDDDPAELSISAYSLERWQALSDMLPEACAYRRNGTLWLAANDEEMAVAEAKAARLKARGVACELVNPDSIRRLEPEVREGLAGALRLPDDGILYAPNTADWLLDHPRIRRRSGFVTNIEGPSVRLVDGSVLHADVAILANGIQAPLVCPGLPIAPKKGHVLITDRYPGRVRHTVTELGYVTSVHNTSGSSVACNVQPRPTGQLFIGTSRQFDTDDPLVDTAVLGRMIRHAISYMPGLAALNVIRVWTGFRAATPDGLPLLGEHPDQPGLWLAVGHEGLGVTTATGSADLLVALIHGENAPFATGPFSPNRYLRAPAHA
jgi:glycine/D-amino acid oxidase-like deaminating enzyme